MDHTKTSDPKLRWFFIVAMSLALLFQIWAACLRFTAHPAPKWTELLPIVPIQLVFGSYILLVPLPGMTRNIRRAALAIFFGVSALDLLMYFF